MKSNKTVKKETQQAAKQGNQARTGMDAHEYASWLAELKQRYQRQQIKAAVQVNSALLEFYWKLGHDIVERDWENVYGSGFFRKLSADLTHELPDAKGFSPNNLWYIKRFFMLYSPIIQQKGLQIKELQNLPQLVGKLADTLEDRAILQLFCIPWGLLICKSKNNVLAKYALESSNVPIGVSEYELSKLYPVDFKSSLPSIEEIERELSREEA